MYVEKNFEHSTIKLGSTTIYIVRYSEFDPNDYLQFLSETEQERLASFNHIKRKREYCATRILKHELFGYLPIEYNTHGAPYIKGQGFISISHSNHHIAIAVNEAYQIGLDLEPISPKAMRLASKFISEEEHSFLDSMLPIEMTAAWSCKETMYKLAGRKKIIFKTQLKLIEKSEDTWKGEIHNPNEIRKVSLKVIKLDELIITLNNEPITYEAHT